MTKDKKVKPDPVMADKKPGEVKQKMEPDKKPEEAKHNKKFELFDVQKIAGQRGIPEWETAGMMRAVGWASGKQVTKTQFETALTNFRNRRQGGGRI